ncbi:hypothetical protein AQJ27_32510 [Streptomyces olivochromogenes]|uniref:Membrane protein n=1 Tax=Streptomyces olivochromogenes TaxID=1963 RepID=A0A250VIW3_STROL|nr:hypothetical protein AQJ27_32510 [Streptomyces olivochromogenes]GAX53989.1 membrane protein [Streptomyces olivochromogenes]
MQQQISNALRALGTVEVASGARLGWSLLGVRWLIARSYGSSIIVGAAIGAVFFKERFGAPRIAAAGLLVVGIGLMLHAG